MPQSLWGPPPAATAGHAGSSRRTLPREPPPALALPPALPAAIPTFAALPAADALTTPLVAMALIMLVAQLLGELLERLGQRRVIGEIVGGIALGPSLLGPLAPGLEQALFMLLIGLVLNPGLLQRRLAWPVASPWSASPCRWPWGSGLRSFWSAGCRISCRSITAWRGHCSWALPWRSQPSRCWRGSGRGGG